MTVGVVDDDAETTQAKKLATPSGRANEPAINHL